MKKIYMLTFVAIMLFVPLHAFATLIPFSATLAGSFEVPANASTATGFADLIFDDVTKNLSWDITFSNLTATATAAHFHGPAAPGVSAGVKIVIPGISGLSSGLVSGSALLTPDQESYLLSELLYINIHDALYPGGEIRGQVEHSPVPEPSTLLLIGTGFAVLVGFRRKLKNI